MSAAHRSTAIGADRGLAGRSSVHDLGAAKGRSAAVLRVAAVIDEMSREPRAPERLSELASRVGISHATLHSLLTTLCDVGWLVRHPVDKSYRLGPRLVTIGRAAEAAFPAVALAEAEAQRLADRFDTACTVSAERTGEICVVAIRQPSHHDLAATVAEAVPFCAPFGAPFVAWRSDADVAAWLDRAPVPIPEPERDAIRAALGDLREHGVGAERLTDFARLQELVAAAGNEVGASTRARLADALPELAQRRTLLWSELADAVEPAPLGMVFGAIGDPDGRVVVNLGVHVRIAEPPAGYGAAVAEAVREAAARVMGGIGGHLDRERQTKRGGPT